MYQIWLPNNYTFQCAGCIIIVKTINRWPYTSLWRWPDPIANVSCTLPSNDIAILLQYCGTTLSLFCVPWIVNTHGFPIKTQLAVGRAQNISNLCNLGWDKGEVKSEVQKILFWIPGDCQNWRGPPQSTARKNAVKTSLGKKEEKLDFRTTVLISGGQRKLWQLNILELY